MNQKPGRPGLVLVGATINFNQLYTKKPQSAEVCEARVNEVMLQPIGHSRRYQTNANHQPSSWYQQQNGWILLDVNLKRRVTLLSLWTSSFHSSPRHCRGITRESVFKSLSSKLRLRHDWHPWCSDFIQLWGWSVQTRLHSSSFGILYVITLMWWRELRRKSFKVFTWIVPKSTFS